MRDLPEWLQPFTEELTGGASSSESGPRIEPVVGSIPTPRGELPRPHSSSAKPLTKKPGRKHVVFMRFAKDPNCEVCQRTEATRAPCRRSFGKPSGQNSSRKKTLRILYQRKSDYRNGYRVSYPCKKKNKDVQYTMRSSRRFLSPEADPKIICTMIIMEFTKACEGLHWKPWQVFSSQITNRPHC